MDLSGRGSLRRLEASPESDEGVAVQRNRTGHSGESGIGHFFRRPDFRGRSRIFGGDVIQPSPLIGPAIDNFLVQYGLGYITTGLGVTFYFGGTSLLIVVGVAMDTVQQIESQLIMRHYEGFLKKGRIRGRRG